MRKIIMIVFLLSLCAVTFYFMFITPNSKDEYFYKEVCETKKIKIFGVIKGFGGHGMYQWIEVDNLKLSVSILLNEAIKNKHNCRDNIEYTIGDSIIKQRNSTLITIKRGGCKTYYNLICND